MNDDLFLLRTLLEPGPEYAPVLAGFEAIDEGRRLLEDPTASVPARRAAEDRVWAGNLQLLEHEQRKLGNPTSTTSRACRPGSSRWARSRPSKCAACGARSPTSRRSIESSLARIIGEACEHLSRPCLLPHPDL